MGLISRVSSRTYRFKKWPSISTEFSQTLTSESERPGPNSPKPGSTSQPKKSPDDPLELLKPPLSPHDQSPVLSDPMSNLPIQRQGSSRTRFLLRRTQRCWIERY